LLNLSCNCSLLPVLLPVQISQLRSGQNANLTVSTRLLTLSLPKTYS